MRVIPVIDILDGVVVRGVGGRREEYRPLESGIVTSCDPYAVASTFYCDFGRREIYLADLDAILHGRPNWELYQRLPETGVSLLIDAGVRDADQARRVANLAQVTVVVGLETVTSPQMLARMTVSVDTSRLLFSLDMRAGRPMSSNDWPTSPTEIVREVTALGVEELIVLDLADVGTSSGGSTDELCRELLVAHPALRIIAGGGVRGPADLERLRHLGVDGVLVASAIHDGRLSHAEILAIEAQG